MRTTSMYPGEHRDPDKDAQAIANAPTTAKLSSKPPTVAASLAASLAD